MRKLVSQFIRDDRGQDLIEYALLGGIITAVGAAVIQTMGGNVSTLMNNLSGVITAALGGGGGGD